MAIEAGHAMHDQAHRRSLKREVFEGGTGVESMHWIRVAVFLEDFVREYHDQHGCSVAPGLVRLHEQSEEGWPVGRVAMGIEEPPLLLVVG